MAQMDKDWEIERLTERLDSLQSYTESLEREMERRDKWLIHAIWGAMDNITLLTNWAMVAMALYVLKLGEWWHVSLGCLAAFGLQELSKRKNRKMQADDNRKIGVDSVVKDWP